MSRRALLLAAAFALLAFFSPKGLAQKSLPDLTVTSLTLAPASVAPGGAIDITSEIRNIGAGPAPLPATVPPSTSAWVDYFLVTSPTDTHGDRLTGWGPLVAMPPGSAQHYTSHATIPASKAPGAYFVCADVDPTHLVPESNESNNRLCRPLTVTGGKGAGLPDLTITGVSVGGVTGVSRAVKITVRNGGTAPATNFRVDAYQLSPRRWQLLFTTCAQTVRGGSASCGSVWETGTLAAGASRTYAGWVTFPADHKPKSTEKVEFMADGCFPALEPALPAGCRVTESNEANNTAIEPLGVP